MVTLVAEQIRSGKGVQVRTDRVGRRRDEYFAVKPQICAERSRLLTEYWKQSEGEPHPIRRAKAFQHILDGISLAIRDGELIVGNQTKYIRGCSVYPEIAAEWVVEDLHKADLRSSGEAVVCTITEEERRMVEEDCAFWKDKAVFEKAKGLFKELWGNRVTDSMEARVCSAALDMPQGGVSLDYAKALNSGLNGVIEEAREQLLRHQIVTNEDLQKRFFWQGVIIACEAVIRFAQRHAELAEEMAAQTSDPARKQELEEIARICRWVPANPARNFREAVQSFWFIHVTPQIETCSAGFSPGRFDQYMYPFYQKDVREGSLTRDEAAELLGCLWVKFAEIEILREEKTRKRLQGTLLQNLTIGGQTREGRDATNELSYLILDVVRQMKLTQPTVSLRYHDGLPEDFLMKAVDANREFGGGQPAWFNDKAALVNLPSMGVPLADARDWVPIGCVERAIPGATPLLTTSGFITLGKVLELTLNEGVDPQTGKRIGPATGDPRSFASFAELYQAFGKQLEYVADTLANAFNVGYALHADIAQIPFISSLQNDCIAKGLDVTQGGCRWNNFLAMVPHGHQNVANSFAAMKKLVYEEKAFPMSELLEALALNFEGKEDLRQKLLAAPKYGNDEDYVDTLLDDLFQLTDRVVTSHKNAFGERMAISRQGHSFHYFSGQVMGATPDGRKASEPTADGSLSPFRGTDMRGPTAVINSAAKVDALGSMATLLNQKFHPSALQGKDGVRKLLALIKTHFDNYGHHIQFNMLSRETLLDAKKHPERYRDLTVRVAGFSAYFVELSPEVQDEIIARTEQSL